MGGLHEGSHVFFLECNTGSCASSLLQILARPRGPAEAGAQEAADTAGGISVPFWGGGGKKATSQLRFQPFQPARILESWPDSPNHRNAAYDPRAADWKMNDLCIITLRVLVIRPHLPPKQDKHKNW